MKTKIEKKIAKKSCEKGNKQKYKMKATKVTMVFIFLSGSRLEKVK